MEWTCAECGISETAEAVDVLVKAGWWITELGRGLCSRCAQRATNQTFEETLERARVAYGSAVETRGLATQMREEARDRIRRTRL